VLRHERDGDLGQRQRHRDDDVLPPRGSWTSTTLTPVTATVPAVATGTAAMPARGTLR